MNGYYRARTRAGTFLIIQRRGRWHALFGDEDLGSYASPQQAADDLAGGHTYTPSCGDTSRLGLSSDVGDWEFVRTL